MRGVVVGLLVVVIATAGVAAANELPMAEAGLDQESSVNSTVYLDAGGSLDPDGEITAYEWEIERPNGTTTVPDCETCPLTHFVPMRPGQYNVTVTVTDDDGATMNDTMYVSVSGWFTPPSPSPPDDGSGNSWAGGGWGGGNADSVSYNYQSGNLWIDLAENSNNVQLSGAERDPAEWGAEYNAWITDEEIDILVDSNRAERFDDRIKVVGEAAQQLRLSLDPNKFTEHKYADAKTYIEANKPANNVLNFGSNGNKDTTSKYRDKTSGAFEFDGSAYSPSVQRSEGADSARSGRSHSTSSDSSDSSEPNYRPEGCTMAAFCP